MRFRSKWKQALIIAVALHIVFIGIFGFLVPWIDGQAADKAPAGCQTGSTLQTAPAAESFSRSAELTKKSYALPCVYISAKTGSGVDFRQRARCAI